MSSPKPGVVVVLPHIWFWRIGLTFWSSFSHSHRSVSGSNRGAAARRPARVLSRPRADAEHKAAGIRHRKVCIRFGFGNENVKKSEQGPSRHALLQYDLVDHARHLPEKERDEPRSNSIIAA